MNPPAKEPAIGIGGSITAVLFAVFAVLKASGVPVTEDMSAGLNALTLALCAVPAISGFITRFFVYSPNSVESIANTQYNAGVPPTEPQPDVPPPADVK